MMMAIWQFILFCTLLVSAVNGVLKCYKCSSAKHGDLCSNLSLSQNLKEDCHSENDYCHISFLVKPPPPKEVYGANGEPHYGPGELLHRGCRRPSIDAKPKLGKGYYEIWDGHVTFSWCGKDLCNDDQITCGQQFCKLATTSSGQKIHQSAASLYYILIMLTYYYFY